MIDLENKKLEGKILTIRVTQYSAVSRYIPLYCSVDKEGFEIPYSPYKPLKVILQNIDDEDKHIIITSNLSENKLSFESNLPTAYVVSGKDWYIETFAHRTGKTTYINSNIYNEYAFNTSKMMRLDDYRELVNNENTLEQGE